MVLAAWPLESRGAGSNSPRGSTVTHPGAVAVAVNCFVMAAIWAGAASKQASTEPEPARALRTMQLL